MFDGEIVRVELVDATAVPDIDRDELGVGSATTVDEQRVDLAVYVLRGV